MLILFILIFLINNIFVLSYNIVPISPTKYIPYSRVKKIFVDIYNIDKETTDYNIEHVVPQSKFKKVKNLKSDMHNLFYYPSKMNTHRSNYKYISDLKFYEKSTLIDENGNRIKYEYPIDLEKNNICIKTANKQYFLPCEKYRGEIARASMYFLSTYPDYKNLILNDVIDPYTILTWHHQYPVSEFEKYKNSRIYDYQGNNNIFVSEPKLLKDYMEEILNTNLDFYNDYSF
jgi:endonuclease I